MGPWWIRGRMLFMSLRLRSGREEDEKLKRMKNEEWRMNFSIEKKKLLNKLVSSFLFFILIRNISSFFILEFFIHSPQIKPHQEGLKFLCHKEVCMAPPRRAVQGQQNGGLWPRDTPRGLLHASSAYRTRAFESRGFLLILTVAMNNYLSRVMSCYTTLFFKN